MLPKLAEDTGQLLNDKIEHWDQSQTPLLGTPVSKFKHLMKRVDAKDVAKMVEESKEKAAALTDASTNHDSEQALIDDPLSEQCTIDDFTKVDLRIARVLSAEQVPEARKLLKLTLGLGGDHQRTVFAGIKAGYEPDKLVGRLVVMVANLKPRQMKFGLSEGMVCAAGPGGKDIFLIAPDDGAKPGQRVT